MDLTEFNKKDAKKLAKASVLSTSDDPKKQDRARARQVEVDYKDLLRQIKAKKKPKKAAVESFEIDKSAHKKVQKKAKLRNLAKGNTNPNEKAAAEKKAGGPKLIGEVVKGEDTQRRKDASAERRSGTVGGVKTPKRLSPSKGRDYVKGTKASIDWWKNRKKVNEGKSWKDFKQAMKSAVKKKNAPKHDYGRDAGAEAKKRLKKKDHETVNFLDPDD